MGSMKTILIIGANSDIAKECALIWAGQGHNLILTSRDLDQLNHQADILNQQGAGSVKVFSFDVTVLSALEDLVRMCYESFASIDLVFIAHGVLLKSDCDEAKELKSLEKFLNVNGMSTILLIRRFINEFIRFNQGHIAVLSSIAGDRARPSNLEYGLSKQMVSFYMEGLRKESYEAGITLTLIKPGLIRTKMTEHLPDGMLFTSSKSAAKSIVSAIEAKKFEVYVPAYWRLISIILR